MTVPTAPSLKTTVLLAAVGSKPKPLIRERGRVGGQAGSAGWSRPASTVATCTAVPLLTLSVVTTAVRLPAVDRLA